MLRFLWAGGSPALVGAILLITVHGTAALNTDWPQFLGPNRNGTYLGPPLGRSWSSNGPPVLWQRPTGAGFSGPAVSAHRLILFHRVDNRATVECLDPRTGAGLWKSSYPTDYHDDFGFDEGPRSTPSIAGNRVITYGAEGRLSCWNLADGALLWAVDTQKEFGSAKGFFGRACSPLVEGDLVIINLGGRGGAGIMAFDCATGKPRWQATADEASYASPVLGMIHERRAVLSLTREALVALKPENGQLYFRYPWCPSVHASVSAATPLVIGDFVSLSASYSAGAKLLRLGEHEPETIWASDDSLSNHYATSVYHEGYLYGWHGRQEQGCELRCVELRSGRVQWKEPGLTAGTITLAGDDLLVLTEKGLLLRAPVAPAAFKPNARIQVLPFGVRAYPALADGLFFARSKDRLFCLDLNEHP